jgi:hypothetical protein
LEGWCDRPRRWGPPILGSGRRAAAGQAASDYAKVMIREGVPVRDIAELLDISPQRVSQIANSTYEKLG